MNKTFLQAEWRKLAIANYEIDPKVLEKYLPFKTEIDHWGDTCYLSLVGFMFKETRLKGLRIPFHVNFEEVNLRFYVRYQDNGNWKRGVVFIKEIVPRPALTFIANTVYHENYETMPMKHKWITSSDNLQVEYQWKKKTWNTFSVLADMPAIPITEGSEEEFITEHYWGYTRHKDDRSSEYKVEHPRWAVYMTKDHLIDVDFGNVYGSAFEFLRHETPRSVFLAEGSAIEVKEGRFI